MAPPVRRLQHRPPRMYPDQAGGASLRPMQNPSRRSVLLAGLAAAGTAAGGRGLFLGQQAQGRELPGGRRRRFRPDRGRRHRRCRLRRAHRGARAHPARQVRDRPRGEGPGRRSHPQPRSRQRDDHRGRRRVHRTHAGPHRRAGEGRRGRHVPDVQRGLERAAAERQAHALPGDRPADRSERRCGSAEDHHRDRRDVEDGSGRQAVDRAEGRGVGRADAGDVPAVE